MSDVTPRPTVTSPFPPQAQASHEAGPSNYAKLNGFQTLPNDSYGEDGVGSQTTAIEGDVAGQSRYTTPTAEEVETTLPPWQPTNPPIALVTERLIKEQYWILQDLMTQRLPFTAPRDRPRVVIHYAQTARQSTLKLLALLRWKSTIDVGPGLLALPSSHVDSLPAFPNGFGEANGVEQTPSLAELNKGRLRDISRVITLMEYYADHFKQNVLHLENVRRQVDSLRIRNADLLSAIDLHVSGTYTRLPTSLTDFIPPTPLSNREIIPILAKLDTHLRYRLRALDYVPPDLAVEKIENGKAYFRHRYGAWTCAMTVLGFGIGPDGNKDSWCLLDVDFGVTMNRDEKLDGEGDDLKDLVEAKMNTDLRDEVIRMAGMVLQAQPTDSDGEPTEGVKADTGVVDAPLARVCNLLQTISLSYQLEVLHNQALRLAAFAWRDCLRVEMAKDRKSLRVDYWVRPRPTARPVPTGSASQSPLVGGSLSFRLGPKAPTAQDSVDAELEELVNGGIQPSHKVQRTAISVRWEAAEGNWLGMPIPVGLEGLAMEVDPRHLDIEVFIIRFTRLHAERLTRALSTAIISNSRASTVFEHNGDVALVESVVPSEPPAALYVPLPSGNTTQPMLVISVSTRTGTIELREEGVEAASSARKQRLDQATSTVNLQPSKILEVVWRLTAGIIMDRLYSQLLQLGWNPCRRIGVRLSELTKAGLQAASALFVQLPNSPHHYIVATIHKTAFRFGLLQLRSIPAESGLGTRLAVGDLGWLDLDKIVGGRKPVAIGLGKRKRGGRGVQIETSVASAGFIAAERDLRDIHAYCNARVAHLKVEQQFKDRGIPYTLVFPPSTKTEVDQSVADSRVIHLIPSFCVNAKDLLKDGRAVDVAMPNVAMQIRGWWKSGPCQVITSVKLRHQPPLRTTADTPAEGGPSTLQSNNISFDPSTSVVSFLSSDLNCCLVTFLEQWERLSKVIVVAGEVNRVNKKTRFADVKMLSFDLKTASFTYSPGYATSITYTPASDSYDASFYCTDGAGDGASSVGKVNPHDTYAPLWSDKLNELASLPDASENTCSRFVGLLRHSLPLLTEFENMDFDSGAQPRLVVRSVAHYRLVWDVAKTRRHAVDIVLQPASGLYFLHDATQPLQTSFVDTSCGVLTPMDGFAAVVSAAFDTVRNARNGETWSPSCPPLVKLQGSSALLCHADFVVDALRQVIQGLNSSLHT